MALDKDRWGAARAAAVQGIGITAGTPISGAQLTAIWTKISEADIAEIEGHAEVLVTSVSGVTPGGSTSGPGAGTIL